MILLEEKKIASNDTLIRINDASCLCLRAQIEFKRSTLSATFALSAAKILEKQEVSIPKQNQSQRCHVASDPDLPLDIQSLLLIFQAANLNRVLSSTPVIAEESSPVSTEY